MDDLLIFVNGGKAWIQNLMGVIRKYESVSGQLVNPSLLFFSQRILSMVVRDN